MAPIDILFLFGFLGIWIPQAFWAWLSYQAWKYSKTAEKELQNLPIPERWPVLSVLIPAYNEGVVIEDTLHAIAQQDYPAESYEVLLINDGSKDNTLEIAENLAKIYPCIKIVNVPKGMGGKGKSRTLNNGLPHAKGELIVVYDADSTPEPDCVRLLAQTLLADKKLVAVNGKVRTRNWQDSILTRFIAIEFIFFQWIFQGGRWQRFELSTLMGTNYVIWRDALETLGGFDEKSLVDDTEMSFRIFIGQKRIKWVPYAIGWQQDPPSLSVFVKQRSAKEVAIQLTTHDALGAHARDEIGIHENTAANPIQAALSSAASFSFGAFFPMLAILFSPEHLIMPSVLITGIAALAILGALSSYFAGTSKIKGSLRITLWGILAMAFSSWIGSLFNVTPL
ncbi:glycosyltransferase [Acinetobacter baumannii]|nr:glycosyltransferase [Acinetobacter baumannii]MDQ8866233.1 glycosyltransferase [Acinetobacter baumannii]MDQ9952326.1 glycosyltransferase [Acinetobacter baumannii]